MAKCACDKMFRFAVIGFGPSFNMGPCHINSIKENQGFELAAVCDASADRQKAAKEAYPGIETFGDVDQMLAQIKPALTTIITPHCTHAELAIKALKAGSSVVVEKPMCITTKEVKAMMKAAKDHGVMLSTFHNRRWDKDFVVLRDLVRAGTIGKVFRIEAGFNGYGKQGSWWRSNREISGGAIYDWGAHFTDWILQIGNDEVAWVSGYQVKNPEWTSYTNEDHSEYTVGFANGCIATLTMSNLSLIERPRWIVRGDKGSIVAGNDSFTVKRHDGTDVWTTTVPYSRGQGDWNCYYRNVCSHLRDGEELVITAESAGRVICVLDCANRSAAAGGKQIKPELP